MAFPASRVLNFNLNPSTVASWNSTIRSTVDRGLHREALLLYRQMKRAAFQPDHLTFPFVLKACSRLSDDQIASLIHAHIVKSPFSSDRFVGTAMVDMYIKCQHSDIAEDLFEEMPERDIAAWNAMLTGFAEAGCLSKVLVLFSQIRLEGIKADSVTIIGLTLCLGIRVGAGANVSVANTWVSAYAKNEDLDSAEVVFGEIPVGMQSVVSWNSMIAGCTHLGRLDKVRALFYSMTQEGVPPDLSTMVSLLSSCAHSEALIEGKLVHSLAIKEGFSSDVSFTNTLILMYSNCGDLEAASYCFSSMSKRTCVSWTVLISGYAKMGNIDEAMDLFHAMEASGEKPDVVTVIALLSACSQTGDLELGRTINKYALLYGLEENLMVRNALIDMYSKCGCINDAKALFDRMCKRTIISWTTMIMGYAMNGKFEEALNLFTEVLELGLKPNHVTFLAVLQACTHGGFLEKGQNYFNMMRRMYGVEPRLEHYSCMVDLFGRRGKVKEALKFIEKMPMKPDAGIWGTLLGACITYQETKVGEYVAKRLFELEPNAAASYVGMANIYAARKRWEGVAKIRAMMKDNGVRKLPGQSIVRINGKTRTFTVEDRDHPEALEVYAILDGLALNLKEEDHGVE